MKKPLRYVTKTVTLSFALGLCSATASMAAGPGTLPPAPAEATATAFSQDRTLERAAGRILKKAIELYNDKAYWHATRDLVVILDFYEKFSKIDEVIYYLGSSLLEMNMHRSADKMFEYLVAKYPRSEFVPNALLGMQQIRYNSHELDNSLQYFIGLTTRYPSHMVMDGAYYYGGMAYFHQKQYDQAIEALQQVSSRSDYYDYSLYTIGLSLLKKKIFSSQSAFFAS